MQEATARERHLEQRAKDAGAAAVRKQVLDAEQKGRGADTPAGVDLIKRGVAPLAEAIGACIAEARAGKVGPRMTATRIMEQLPADVLAYFALKVALSAAISSSGLTTTASEIGAMIEEELRLCAFEGAEPALYRTIERQLSERGAGAGHARRVFVFAANKANVELPRLTRVEKLHVGVKLIELLIATTGFVESVNIRVGRKTQARLRPTEKVADWINDRNISAALMRPRFLPMVERPRDWTGPKGGGYLTSALRALPIVKRPTTAQQEALASTDMPVVYRALNAIQSTGWRVNGRVLDVLERAWDCGLTGALPNREDEPLPHKPAALANCVTKEQWAAADPDLKKEWKIAARRVHEQNATSRGKRVNLAQIIGTAGEMRNDPFIAFPHQLDFRGRAYAIPSGLKGGDGQIKNAKMFVDWVGPNTSEKEALTPAKVREYLAHCRKSGNATSTLNRKISAISVLIKHSNVERFELPWNRFDWSKARKRFFSVEQEREVIALLTTWGRERERDLFMFLCDVGLRPWAEAAPSKWKQYKLKGGKPFIVDVIGKSGMLRDVPLTPRAWLAVERQDRTLAGPWAWANQYTLNDLWDRILAAVPSLGVNEDEEQATVWYTCRHTFASRLIMANVSYGNVAKYMDNSVQMIQKVYGHLSADHMHDDIAALEKYSSTPHLSVVKDGLGG